MMRDTKTTRKLPLVEPAPPKAGRFYFLFDKEAKQFMQDFLVFNDLTALCVSHSLLLKKLSDFVTKEELNGEIDIETYAEISSLFWRDKLIPFLKELHKRLQIIDSLKDRLTPTIEVPSSAVFVRRLCEPHSFLASAVYFGNFLNRGKLLVHWEISNRYTEPPKANKLQDDLPPITVDFMHDEATAFFKFKSFEFENVDDNELYANKWGENNPSKPKCDVTYTLRLSYKNVKRLYIDFAANPPGKNSSTPVYMLHFHTVYPVEIFRLTRTQKQKLSGKPQYGDGDRCRSIFRGRNCDDHPSAGCLADSPVFSIACDTSSLNDKELYNLLSRLHYIGNFPIFIAPIKVSLGLLKTTYHARDNELLLYFDASNPYFIQQLRQAVKDDKGNLFTLRYLIEAILSRGAPAKDRLLRNQDDYRLFITNICNEFRSNPKKVINALEDLVDAVEDMHVNRSIHDAFNYLIAHPCERAELTEQLEKDGYMKVRKIVVTPTRLLYVPAEVQMGNRVLREYGGENSNNLLRIVFREDSGGLLRNLAKHDFIVRRAGAFYENSFVAGGEKFFHLGQSNSQLRDQGSYFIKGETTEDANRIRGDLGKLHLLPTIPKMVSRMGQCFTQSRELKIFLQPEDYKTECDVTGGSNKIEIKGRSGSKNTIKKEPYIFSDGVGRTTQKFLHEVAGMSDRRYRDYTPSCVQFRFRGYKGVLTMDPNLDNYARFLDTLNLNTENLYPKKIVFRDSQHKFKAPRQTIVEVVKFSGPSEVALNRPFINILCQVSEAQGKHVHKRVRERIRILLERHTFQCAKTLWDEKTGRDKLKDLPIRFDVDALTLVSGMHLTSEPFFRSLLKNIVRYSLKKTLSKEQIEIPHNLGRSMFGVIDETGLLQYGQVFVQYTKSINDRVPLHNAATNILEGPILITKNPAIVAGDVRIFKAVDIPELHHLIDVVVFPRHGPRPHPDEMAGSDLDGDEYSVIWDPELLFEYNEEAMNFLKHEAAKVYRISPEEFRTEMVKFLIEYMKNDMIGIVSTAHLIQSDHYGLFEEISVKLAEQHSIAVDFPKTGVPPQKMDTKWEKNERLVSNHNGDEIEVVVHIPGTKQTRSPDFMQKDYDASYRSQRTVGTVFRSIKEIQTLLDGSIEDDCDIPLELDPTFDYPGWEMMKKEAREHFEEWIHSIKRILERYGVTTAAELFTGFILEMRNKALEREGDQVTYFTTGQTIETTMTNLWITFRKNFFESEKEGHHYLGKYDDLTEAYQKPWIDETQPLQRHVTQGTDDMYRKAVAYYRVAYEHAANERRDRSIFTSFPWLVWDVLQILKVERARKETDAVYQETQAKEFHVKLLEYIKVYCNRNSDALRTLKSNLEFFVNLKDVLLKTLEGRPIPDWKRIPDDNLMNFVSLCCFIAEWVNKSKIEHIRDIHVVILFINFASGRVLSSKQFQFKKCEVEGEILVENPGKLVATFLEYLGSRTFLAKPMLSFEEFGLDAYLIDGEWQSLHRAARRTFYSISFSGRFDMLIGEVKDEGISTNASLNIHEDVPFITELQNSSDDSLSIIRKKLLKAFGLVDLQLRRAYRGNPKEFGRVRVTAMGSADAIRKLRRFLIIDAITEYHQYAPDLDKEYAKRITQKIKLLDDPDNNLLEANDDEDF